MLKIYFLYQQSTMIMTKYINSYHRLFIGLVCSENVFHLAHWFRFRNENIDDNDINTQNGF